MGRWPRAIPLLLVGLLAGCASTLPSNYDQWVYPTRIESEPSGARIEVNGEYIGRTPLHKVLPRQYYTRWGGLPAGWSYIITGMDSMIVKAYPVEAGYTQVKFIKANQYPPRMMYFDMRIKPAPTQFELQIR